MATDQERRDVDGRTWPFARWSGAGVAGGGPQAVQCAGWTSLAGEICLELVVRGAGRPPSDANYLGGVGDVLQDKTVSRGLDLTHSGDLGAVAPYTDDRQITQIHYTEVPADEASYSVRIRQLDPTAPAATTSL